MKTKIWAGFTATLLATTLVGCAGTGGTPESDQRAGKSSSSLYERSITLTDGRDVTCVIFDPPSNRGGLSCDWEGAR